MEIHFIGTGSAGTLENFQSNSIIKPRTKRMLVDAGGDIRHALHAAGYDARSLSDIDAVYVSHLHTDHIGGLEHLCFGTLFGSKKKLTLYASHNIVDRIWETIRNGVRSIQGRIMEMKDYFDVVPIPPNGSFVFDGTRFQLVQTIHIMDGFEIAYSYGLLFTAPNGQRVFHTTDTQFAPRQIETFYNNSDIIFHDCETGPVSGVHAHYNDLKTLPAETKAKMWLYHYNDGVKPDATADGFAGYIEKGKIFDLSVPSH